MARLNCVALCGALLTALVAHAEEQFAWNRGAAIELRAPDVAMRGDVRVFVGRNDYSALFTQPAPGRIRIDTTLAPLEPGEHVLKIYSVDASGAWEELMNQSIRIRHAGGFDTAEVTPRLGLENKGQLRQGVSGDAFEPDPKTYQDLTAQAGLGTRHTRGGLSMETVFNLVGASRREEALRFGEEGEEAPRLDLSDYQVKFQYGDAELQLGHVSYGRHPLLMEYVGNRGVGVQARINERFDIAMSRQNGSNIVGYNRLLGRMSSDHHISGAVVGAEAFPDEPGKLRVEVSWMDAKVTSDLDFGVGEVQDAEESDGVGVTVRGHLWEQRIRYDLAWAESSYTNPNDPLLAQGDTLVEVEEKTNDARRATLQIDALQNHSLTENVPLSISFELSHSRADPLYRSLGAFTQADNLQNAINANLSIGQANLVIGASEQEDNLDDIPSILKTKTEARNVTGNMPLSMFFASKEVAASAWLPSLEVGYQRVHQYADNNPDAALSGFNGGSHLPDQITLSRSVGLNWYQLPVQLGYRFSLDTQDNRQSGREQADFENRVHSVSVGWQATDTLGLNFSVSRNRNYSEEQARADYTDSGDVSANWQFREHWVLNANLSTSRQYDNLDAAAGRSVSGNLQLGRSFRVPGAEERDGQFFLRYVKTRNENKDNVFAFETRGSSWALSSGVSVSLY